MTYIVSKLADDDIEFIIANGAVQFGEKRAVQYVKKLYDLFGLIAENPNMARLRDDIASDIRIHPYKAHLIIYKNTENNNVTILRVLHYSYDWQSLADL